MEEVGYMAELISRGHRPTPEKEGDVTNLVQGAKRHKPASHRQTCPVDDEETDAQMGEEPASSTNIPGIAGERSTKGAREEHLTAEDWAIMAAVERCAVRRALKALNLRQREKLLAAICMVFQETVGGNEEKSTVNRPENFRDWGRRWGQDEQGALLVMQNQWDNLLRHVMGITAAMEVWEPSTASSSGEDANTIDQKLRNTSQGTAPDGETNGQAQSSGEHSLPPDETPSRVKPEATGEGAATPTQCRGEDDGQADKNTDDE